MPVLNVRGARIRYSVTGDGPPVLLIQGAGVAGTGWRPQIQGLADGYRLIEFDNRGIGGSRLEAGGRVAIEEMAADALAVADAEGCEAFHVVGHSMGGLIAQALALGARHRVRSLSLLCTFVTGREGARLTPALLATTLRMRLGTRRMRREAFLELIMPESWLRTVDRARLAEDLAPLFGHDLAAQPLFVMTQIRAMSRYDAGDRWGELSSIPTLVVSASHDRIARPEYGRRLAALVNGSRFVEIADAGHAVTIQEAETVNALLRQHIPAAGQARPEANAAGPVPVNRS